MEPHSVLSSVVRLRGVTYFQQNYIRLGLLGAGGFGKVWNGFRLSDCSPAAIKEVEMRKVPQWGKLNGERVPMEVVFMVKLGGAEGVIGLMDVCVDEDKEKYLIVMERPNRFLDLFDYISQRRSLGETESRRIFGQVVRAVTACEEHGVFHGDVKDENVVVDLDTGDVKIIDFGGARILRRSHYRTFLGTGLWSPPECLRRRPFTAERATVWSLGCLLYDMLFGDIPFKTNAAALEARLRFRDGGGGASKEARDLIAACLRPEPEKRLSLKEVAAHPWTRRATAPSGRVAATVGAGWRPAKERRERRMGAGGDGGGGGCGAAEAGDVGDKVLWGRASAWERRKREDGRSGGRKREERFEDEIEETTMTKERQNGERGGNGGGRNHAGIFRRVDHNNNNDDANYPVIEMEGIYKGMEQWMNHDEKSRMVVRV